MLKAAAAAAGVDEEDATALQAAHAAPLRRCEAAARIREVNMGEKNDICRRLVLTYMMVDLTETKAKGDDDLARSPGQPPADTVGETPFDKHVRNSASVDGLPPVMHAQCTPLVSYR